MRVHRLKHWQTERGCRILDGRWPESAAATGGSVGLGDHAGDGEAPRQGLQNRNSEIRRAKKHEAHGWMVARLIGGA